jgi:4-hydroxy-3-methylbut-2-enyl diphosphate reductase
MGVRRAVAAAVAEASSETDGSGRVYTLGPLIHNPRVLADLESRGIYPAPETLTAVNLDDCSLIIRAHGIDPRFEEDLRNRVGRNSQRSFPRIVDATCPKVKASQLKAKELAEKGCMLFLAGEAKHAEVAGILGYAALHGKTVCTVVSNSAEAQAAAKKLYETGEDAKTALLAQTTFSEEEYKTIGNAIKKYFPDLEIVDTICAATHDRQEALRELLEQVDAVIIAGGKDSANTRRLFAIAQGSGKPCALVETAAEVPPSFRDFEIVGLCAGASTPDSVIEEIEKF